MIKVRMVGNYFTRLSLRKFSVGHPLRNVMPPKHPKQERKLLAQVSWKTVAVAGAAGGGLLGFLFYVKKEKQEAMDRERRRVLGKAKIGGTFELIDTEGKVRTSEEFLGKWLLIYFGFTHCPDICPDELEKMAKVTDLLDNMKSPPPLQPIFISVDPQRDTPAIVGKYVKEFSPRFLGLTGSVEKVAEICKGFRVYFSSGPRDQDDDYIVDHTIIMYLIDPSGQFVDYYGQTKNADDIQNSIMFNIAKYDSLNKTGWFA